jgi:hypothetical protein
MGDQDRRAQEALNHEHILLGQAKKKYVPQCPNVYLP